MGVDFIRRELVFHQQILEDATILPIFTRVGWFEYFLKLKKFSDDMIIKFATTLEYDRSMVKGILVDASEISIMQVIDLLRIGEKILAQVGAVVAREEFLYQRN
jgi:hypothetical protein